MNNKQVFVFILLLVPSMALANAGSPMMWFGFIHLLIINAVIGIYESSYLTRHKIDNRAWLIIIGNYVSMFIGMMLIAPVFSTASGNHDFWGGNTNYGSYELGGFIMGMFFSYLATILIEYPFFYYAVKSVKQRKLEFSRYFEANTITNVIMFVIYFLIVVRGSK